MAKPHSAQLSLIVLMRGEVPPHPTCYIGRRFQFHDLQHSARRQLRPTRLSAAHPLRHVPLPGEPNPCPPPRVTAGVAGAEPDRRANTVALMRNGGRLEVSEQQLRPLRLLCRHQIPKAGQGVDGSRARGTDLCVTFPISAALDRSIRIRVCDSPLSLM
jgi:hypothetical protein